MYKVTYGVDVVVEEGDPTTTVPVTRDDVADPNDPKVIEGVVAEVKPTVFSIEAVRVLSVEGD